MNTKTLTVLLALSGFSASLTAQTIISVELGSNTALGSSDTAGFVPADNWTQASGFPDFTDVDLNFDDGTASGATISGDFAGNTNTQVAVSGTDLNTTMYTRGGYVASGAGSSLSLAGLPTTGSFASYDLYLYFAPTPDTDVTTNYIGATIGSTSCFAIMDTGDSNYTGTFVQATGGTIVEATAGNYFLFEGLSGATQDIDLISNFGGSYAVTGLQVVAIPEPSQAALLAGLVVCAGIFIRRRR